MRSPLVGLRYSIVEAYNGSAHSAATASFSGPNSTEPTQAMRETVDATFFPRESYMPRVGRSSDSRTQAKLGLLAAGAMCEVLTFGNGNENRTSPEYARSQRRGRPGFAPEFPVVSIEPRFSTDHQRTSKPRTI